MKNIIIFIFFVVWFAPDNSLASNYWTKVNKDDGFNYYREYKNKKGFCQVLLRQNELTIRVLEDTPCSRMQFTVLTIDLKGSVSNYTVWEDSLCVHREKRNLKKDIFKENCLESAKEEMPPKIKRILENYREYPY